jgi:hypothetical protein
VQTATRLVEHAGTRGRRREAARVSRARGRRWDAGASRGELAVWSKRVSGTRAKRRWSEARGVAACEQKTGGVTKT